MKKILEPLLFFVASVFGAWLVFVVAAVFFKVDVFGMFVTSATQVVGVFGDKFPIISTKYGQVQLRSKSSDKGHVIEIGCAECTLQHRLLAPVPFTTANAVLEGVLKKKRFVGDARLYDVMISIDAQWNENNVAGSFDLPPTEIGKLYHAVRSIIPEAEKAQIKGVAGGKGKFSWPEIYFLFKPEIKDFWVDGLVDQDAYKKGKFRYRAEDPDGNPIEVESGEGTPNWITLDEAGAMLPAAVLAVEDNAFYQHGGYDLESIVAASSFNKKSGRLRRGGSTLTQQLAKKLFLTDERTYARKLRELLYAVEINRELGKQRILEIYLNIVEWGPNIFGAKAAAQTYFGRAPAQLLPEEAAWLANILRAPKHAYKQQFLKRTPDLTYVTLTLAKMRNLSESQRQTALDRGLKFAGQQ